MHVIVYVHVYCTMNMYMYANVGNVWYFIVTCIE